MKRNFMELLKARWAEGKFVCVGLDPVVDKIPNHIRDFRGNICDHVYDFLTGFISKTRDFVCAYKPNAAFFERIHFDGQKALYKVISYINLVAPEIPIIYDAKRGDIDSTNEGYAESAFEHLGADAITVSPYMGGPKSFAPYLDRSDKGVFVLCRTSNDDADWLQDRVMNGPLLQRVYEIVAREVNTRWNKHDNCGLVVGATHAGDIARVRLQARKMPILIPGVGAQGGALEESVINAATEDGTGFIVNLSRSVLYASSGKDFAVAGAQEVAKVNERIQKALATLR